MKEGTMILTDSEVKILRALSGTGANPYELASGAELTATEVEDAVTHLEGDHLVKRDGRYLKLTDQGQRVRRSLSEPGLRSRFTAGARVVVVPDRQAVDAYDSLDAAELEAALDAEILKHSTS